MSLDSYIVWDNQTSNRNFQDYQLILPDISIGNVGQLSTDLLLNNIQQEMIGRISHDCFVPFIGSNSFNPENPQLSSSCEIYESAENKLIILQLRSRVFHRKVKDFKELLMNFIKLFNFKRIIVLASSSSDYFPAEQLYGVPIHFLNTSSATVEDFKELKFKKFSLPESVTHTSLIPASFISEYLIEECEKEGIPLIVLIYVCSEGNNYPEASQMVEALNSWLSLKKEKGTDAWKWPVSWNLPFGSEAPRIY